MNAPAQHQPIDDVGDKPTFKIGTKCTFYGTNPHAPDLCPTCGTTLQVMDDDAFWKRISDFEDGTYLFDIFKQDGSKSPDPDWKPRSHPGYTDMWIWMKDVGRCFHHVAHLRNSYKKHTGKEVDLTL